MAQKTIELGTAPDGMDGDDARTAFQKTNDNFTELYHGVGGAQPSSPKLSAIAASVWAANQLLIATGADTVGTLATGVTGRALVAANNAAEGRSAIAAQALHANLTGLSSIPSALNRVPFFTSGTGEMGYFNSTAYTRDFADAVDAATARGKLALGSAAVATVVANNGDTTVGRVLTTGFMGLGSRSGFQLGAANSASYNGFYQGAGAGSTNYPGSTAYGSMLVMCRDQAVISQLAMFGSAAGGAEAHIRGSNDNAVSWSSWGKLFHSGNAVGAVSQSGGVPTGAIMEKGQNAQGFYLRFADGTQLAWGEIGSNTLGAGTVTSTTVTFPIAFYTGAGAPVVSSNFQPQLSWDVYGPISNGVLSTTQVSITIRNGATAQTGTIRWSAVGRWY